MFITRQADYAVRCVLFLSKDTNRVVSAGNIAETLAVSRTFLAKILQRLSRNGIVTSAQGTAGGFELAKKPREINILDVIEAVQGPLAVNLCAVDNHKCGLSRTCAVHPVWVELRNGIEAKLRRETFAKLVTKKKR
ncbi:MAG TPA: Rrf2 family transcriptional regulator [Oculatellaceae cyanobacterium]|nr:Rrf2 family transcriptional regulator [Syntrophorhabdaceae bacterium]